MSPFVLSIVLATAPALLLAVFTWQVVWPRWKLFAKLALHPCLYAVLALLIGHWIVLVAWIYQGIGLAGHIWFSRKHGFKWYAVEDPERYISLSREAVLSLGRKPPSP